METSPDPQPVDNAKPTDGRPSEGTPADSEMRKELRADPCFHDHRFKQLDPRFVRLERLTGLFVVVLVSLGAVLALGGVILANWPPGWWLRLVAGITLLVIFAIGWFAFSWPPIVHKHYRYMADREGLKICRGVLWRSVIFVPRARIQHSDVRQGPFQRRFGLSTLVVHTAGSQHPTIEIDGLSREEALAVRDVLALSPAKTILEDTEI